jgi:hypothetical protein
MVAPVGFNGTTSTGSLNISDINFLPGDYKITVENIDYFTESVFFTYDNQENINVDVFLLNTNATDSGFVTIQVFSSTQQFVPGAVVKALEWNPSTSSFETVAQATTNTNGEAVLNIEIGTKTYKFSADDGTNFKTINEPNGQIVQINGDILPIQFDAITDPAESILEGVISSVVFTNVTDNVTIVSFSFSDSNNLVNEACIKFYRQRGNIKTLLNESCVQTSTGEIIEQFYTNNTYNLFVEATILLDSQTRSMGSQLFKGTGDISFSLKEYGLDVLVPLVAMLIGLGLGLVMSNIYIAVALMNILIWLSLFIVPGVLSTATALFLSVVGSLAMWGGFKK